MEVLCRWCLRVDTCDCVDVWDIDAEGMHSGASELRPGTCPEFEANPDNYAEIIAQAVRTCDLEEYGEVSVEITHEGSRTSVEVAVVTVNLLNQQEIRERVDTLVSDLQQLNDETLHISEADFVIVFMHPTEDEPGDPVGLDEDGNIISLEGAATGDEVETCPICNSPLNGPVCPGCGYDGGNFETHDSP